MEGFIDDYSRVRLVVSITALAVLAGFALFGTRSPELGISVVSMGVIAIHAGWSITSGVRNPRLSLALDMTVTTIAGWSAVNLPARGLVLAVWCVIIPFLTYGRWRIAFYGYAVVSYLAVISRANPPQELGATVRTLFIAGIIVVVLNNVSRRTMALEVQRSQLLGSVSHELRNQLTGVMGMIDLALDDAVVPSPEEVKDLIGLARREAGDAAGIIEDLLAASRMENNALDVAFEQVDVDLEVARIVDHYPTEGMSLSHTRSRSGVMALADQIRVRQVLRNLLSNAVRYGGKSISISVQPDGAKVFVRVADDGPGVPVGEEESIFLPYRRATSTRRHKSSVGLGLWVSRRLARAMGGDLTYQRENTETVFELSLPVYVPLPTVAVAAPAFES